VVVGWGVAVLVGYRSGEGVEDHVEPEFELVAEVVAGLEDVCGDRLDDPSGTSRA
jgi:hypothetical protein